MRHPIARPSHRPLLRGLASLTLGALIAAAPAAEDQAAASGTTGTRHDNATGSEAPMTAAQTQADLEAAANRIKAMTTAIQGGSVDNLYHNVITYNSEQIDDLNRSRTSNGVIAPKGMSINLGPLQGTLGGEVTDIDNQDSFPTAPETVHFITAERNQLSSLDNKMRRNAAWLNKHTCGGFDWAAQFNFMFKLEALKEYVKNLGEGILAAAPMALLGAFSPQLAEIVKHLKLIAGFDLSATKMDCQTIQNALTDNTRKAMWGNEYSKCMNDHKDDITTAVKVCQNSMRSSVPNEDGSDTNTNTSQAASTQGGWLTNAYSKSNDWFSNIYPASGGAQAAGGRAGTAAGTAAGNGGATGNQQQGMQGVGNATSGGSGANVRETLGNDVGSAVHDLASTLFGSVRFQGTGAFEAGKKSYPLFKLKLDAYSAELHDKLIEQINQHWVYIGQVPPNYTVVGESYLRLKQMTFQSRGGDESVQPWLNHRYNSQVPAFPMDVLCQRIDA